MRIFARLALFVTIITAGLSPAISDDSDDDYKPFIPSETLMSDHKDMLKAAAAANQRLMIVIGANWCHDTMSFIEKTETNETTGITGDNLRTMLVDVGAFDTQWETLLDHYKMPTIYGTPTVLIVDPESDTILNPISMHRWRDAYKEEKSTIQGWLDEVSKEGFFEANAHAQATHDWQHLALNRLDEFEAEQATRIRAGFRAMQKVFETEDEVEKEALNKKWYILADMRYSLITFLQDKRAAIVADGAAESVAQFDLPTFELFDDL